MPVSPRTQQLQAGMAAGPDQESALFEQGFSDMAYNLLSARMPDLIEGVVTFKIIQTDLEKGLGIGAFIIMRNGTPIYVPVVMSDNAVKPLDLFYHKASNMFMPLTKGWLEEVDKNSIGVMGDGVKTPETLYTDVDLRNVVVPPITGRFSYAAWVPKAMYDVSRVCSLENLENSQKHANAHGEMLLQALRKAPNRVKQAFQKFLEKNPRTMKQAAAVYTVSALAEALRPRLEKVAAKQQYGGALWIADKDTTPSEFRRVFGDKAGEAYAGVRLKGYAAKDDRPFHSVAVQEQPYARWTEPDHPGVYTLYTAEGRETPAFVVPNAIDIFDEGHRYAPRPLIPGRIPAADRTYPYGRPDQNEHRQERRYTAKRYIAVFGNGDYILTDTLVGQASIADDLTGPLHKQLFSDVDGTPRPGKGFFVRQKGSTFQSTVPVKIVSISTDANGVRRIKATDPHGYGDKSIVTDTSNPYGTLWQTKGTDMVYLPPDFIWVPLKEQQSERGYHRSAHDLQACISSALSSVGARKVAIKDAGARQFSVDGKRAMDRVSALRALAGDYNLRVEDADALLEKAASDKTARAWVVTGEQLARAQIKVGQDEAAPPQQPPAPPSPVELAAMEMDQSIQQEMVKLTEKQQMLASLLQRSSEIAGGASPSASAQVQAMGAPPPGQGMPPGMDPNAMQGVPPGMDPNAMQGMPPGMDPNAAPPPNAMMPSDGPNAATLPQEISPQFLDQAAQLNANDVFDAAAVASLALSPELHGVVGQYLPTLEQAVDNLARVMLTLWMQENELRPQIGETTFSGLENSLKTTFKGLGDLVLRLSRGVQALKGPDGNAA